MDLPENSWKSSSQRLRFTFSMAEPQLEFLIIIICVKRKERLILFTACTSQINTILTFLSHTSTDPNTIPCIHPNPTNCFRELTFVDCNRVFDYDVQAFLGDIRKGTVRKENGHLSLEEMRLLIRGIKLSKTVADSIKKLFE